MREVYREYLAAPDPAKMPILEDLYNALKKQPEAEAARVAAALELYVHGSLNVFNHRTNIDIHNRLVCFDIKELGKQLKKLGMLIIQDQVWGRVTENRELNLPVSAFSPGRGRQGTHGKPPARHGQSRSFRLALSRFCRQRQAHKGRG